MILKKKLKKLKLRTNFISPKNLVNYINLGKIFRRRKNHCDRRKYTCLEEIIYFWKKEKIITRGENMLLIKKTNKKKKKEKPKNKTHQKIHLNAQC